MKKPAAQYRVLLATVRPRDPAGRTRRPMAAGELADIEHLDAKHKTMKAELKTAPAAIGSLARARAMKESRLTAAGSRKESAQPGTSPEPAPAQAV